MLALIAPTTPCRSTHSGAAVALSRTAEGGGYNRVMAAPRSVVIYGKEG